VSLIVLAVALVIALVTGGAIVGSWLMSHERLERPHPAIAAIPRGPDAVLAFDANGDIFSVRADGTGMRQLTRSVVQEVAPVWSPAGTRIAFWVRGTNQGQLVVMDVSTGVQTVMAETGWIKPGQVAAWSPDGTTLVYSSPSAASLYSHLYLVHA